MSDRFKNALDEYNSGLFEHTEGRFIQERFISNKTVYSIREALTLATEAEQLRKDKEAMERVLNGAKVLLQINSDTIDQLRKERDEWQNKYNALLRVFGTVSDELEKKVSEENENT